MITFKYVSESSFPEYPEKVKQFLPHLEHIDGKLTMVIQKEYGAQAVILFDLVVSLNAKNVLEYGTRAGISTGIFLEAVKKTDGHLWTVDIQDIPLVASKEDEEFISVIKDHSLSYMPPFPMDVIFLDTSHQYEQTLLELERCWQFLKPEGFLICHDYDSHFDCKRAITEWAEHHKIGFIADSRMQGIAVIPKPELPNTCRKRVTFDRWESTPLRVSDL